MSLPEILLWQRLKGSPMGIRFRKQHPIDPYVVDFYAPAANLVIEIDGEAHDRGDRPARDERRDARRTAQGYRLIRIAARSVLANADEVAESILALATTPLHHAPHGSPPRPGEEL
jgi:very-short-patch-repair endonuclease